MNDHISYFVNFTTKISWNKRYYRQLQALIISLRIIKGGRNHLGKKPKGHLSYQINDKLYKKFFKPWSTTEIRAKSTITAVFFIKILAIATFFSSLFLFNMLQLLISHIKRINTHQNVIDKFHDLCPVI